MSINSSHMSEKYLAIFEGNFGIIGVQYIMGNNTFGEEFSPDQDLSGATLKKSDQVGYTGEIKDLLRHGKGTYVFESGDKYVGQFFEDRIEGYGVYQFKNGERHAGNWKNGLASGFGIRHYQNGSRYEGAYLDGRRSGQGTEINLDDSKLFVGEFKNDLRNGRGTLYKNGEILYVGDFVDDRFSGNGKLYGEDGSYYEGQFFSNMMVGNGVTTFLDGSREEGNYWENMKHGTITTYDSNGVKRSVGSYKEDKKDGEMTIYSSDGSGNIEFEITYRRHRDVENNNIIQISGTKYFLDDDVSIRYGGSFRETSGDDGSIIIDGFGTMYYVDGTLWEGVWKDGKIADGNGKAGTLGNLKDVVFKDGKLVVV